MKSIDIEPINLDVNSLVPLGLVDIYLIYHALKHGLRDKKDSKLIVTLHQNTESVILTIEDNGGKLSTNDLIEKEGSLGTRLIKAFTTNLEGELIVKGGGKTKISLIVTKSQFILN